MPKRTKKPPELPHFSSYEEEAAWWDKHGPTMDLGDESTWEELVPSPNGRSIFADTPELDRQRAEVARREARAERARARRAIERAAKGASAPASKRGTSTELVALDKRVVAALGGPDALRAILGALARALPAKKKRRAA